MTAEGVFPKIDGDNLYASEVNRMAGAGYIWSTNGAVPSGNSLFTLGSYLVSGVAFQDYDKAKLTFDYYSKTVAGGANGSVYSIYAYISGTQNNKRIVLGSRGTYTDGLTGNTEMIMGNAGSFYSQGFYRSFLNVPEVIANPTTDVYSVGYGDIPQINPGSPFCIFAQVLSNIPGSVNVFQYIVSMRPAT